MEAGAEEAHLGVVNTPLESLRLILLSLRFTLKP
jgi:hypothetical protein